jgi:hypothetical protein
MKEAAALHAEQQRVLDMKAHALASATLRARTPFAPFNSLQ